MKDMRASISELVGESRKKRTKGCLGASPLRPPTLQLPALRQSSAKRFSQTLGRNTEEEGSGDSRIWGATSRRGRSRALREDLFSAHSYGQGSEMVLVFGIYDGHGGVKAAQVARDKLPANFLAFYRKSGTVESAFKQSFHQTDSEVLGNISRSMSRAASSRSTGSTESVQLRLEAREPSFRDCNDWNAIGARRLDSLKRQQSWAEEHISTTAVAKFANCGTTATTVVLIDQKLHIAHVGDSRAILCRTNEVIRLCEDHRLSRPEELQRIEQCGGLVVDAAGSLRVNGVLAISRAIGDSSLKRFIISEPDVRSFDLTDQDLFVVIASDGVWDHVEEKIVREKVSDCLHRCGGTTEEASHEIVSAAFNAGSKDDISALVIDIRVYLDDVKRRQLQTEPGELVEEAIEIDLQQCKMGGDLPRFADRTPETPRKKGAKGKTQHTSGGTLCQTPRNKQRNKNLWT